MFFHQIIGSPANAFITIVAVIIAFVSAVSFLDLGQKMNDNEENSPYGKNHKK